jgi:hypothetical protein
MRKIILRSLLVVLFITVTPVAQAADTTALSVAPTTKLTPTEIETKLRTYFADVPVMIDIARCESNFRQFTDSGNVFYGGAGGGMIGIFQFHESVHSATARSLGFDLTTVEGNVGYARHLYQQSGTSPWRSCVPAITAPSSDADLLLRIELLKQVISLLQQLLELKLAQE